MNVKDPEIRRILKYFEGRKRHHPRTFIRFIYMEICKKAKGRGGAVPMSKLVEVFTELDSLGIVTLSVQRPVGANTEVHWNRNIIEVGREALKGRLSPLSSAAAATATTADLLHIDFPRDTGGILRLDLPADLSASESSRLAEIIRALGRDLEE